MSKKLAFGIALALAASVAVAPIAHAISSNNPAGNNGFVQISDSASPSHPGNDPHVSCSFYVNFYNYDQNNSSANVNFSLMPPTSGSGYSLSVLSGNLHPSVGGSNAKGGKDLDASIKYTLGFTGAAQAQQGYHVKLVVTVPGSKGSDKKSKVFWVQPCSVSTTGSTNPPTPPQVGGTATGLGGGASQLPNTGANPLQALSLGGVASFIGYIFHRRFVA